MNAAALRTMVLELLAEHGDLQQELALTQQLLTRQDQLVARQQDEIRYKEVRIAQLVHEVAMLKRVRFGKKGEQLPGIQGTLLEDTVAADLAAVQAELEVLKGAPLERKKMGQAKRTPLPAHLPRIDILHEPESSVCKCGCQLLRIGEDVAEKLDYTPGAFTVERHIRGKWVCKTCTTLVQAPVPAQVIDKGVATPGLLAQVLIAKYADHLPLYRQEKIFERAGLKLSRSTLAEWVGVCGVHLQPLADALREGILAHDVVHADETPVQMLKPGTLKTHRAYLWAYATGAFENVRAVVYDFTEGRSGEYARQFLGEWKGKLVCDDYGGYKASFAQGVTEVGCMAHARRKFFELFTNHKSQLAEQALGYFAKLYEVEAEARDLDHESRRQWRQRHAKPMADALFTWMQAQRERVPEGSATAKALDYSLKRWVALTRYLDDGSLPIDNNHVENLIRPIALGRSNWLFAGSLRAGKRAAAVMSLVQSARLNGLDPYAYLKDVLTRLPTQPASRIEELLPHCWQSKTE